jgi:hypothetical protein
LNTGAAHGAQDAAAVWPQIELIRAVDPSTLVIQLRNQQHIMAIVVGFNMCGGNGNP